METLKLILLIAVSLYLIGVIVAFVMLLEEVKSAYLPKSKMDNFWRTLKNIPEFYFCSWYAVILIYLRRQIKK